MIREEERSYLCRKRCFDIFVVFWLVELSSWKNCFYWCLRWFSRLTWCWNSALRCDAKGLLRDGIEITLDFGELCIEEVRLTREPCLEVELEDPRKMMVPVLRGILEAVIKTKERHLQFSYCLCFFLRNNC